MTIFLPAFHKYFWLLRRDGWKDFDWFRDISHYSVTYLVIPVRIISRNATNYYKYMYLICVADDETEIWPLEPMGVSLRWPACPLSRGTSPGLRSKQLQICSKSESGSSDAIRLGINETGSGHSDRKLEEVFDKVFVFFAAIAWLILLLFT